MKNRKNENTFLVVWSLCVVILLFMCFGGISLKGTNAYFGDGTTGSFTVYTVYYYSNYPDETIADVDVVTDKQNSNYNKLLGNMFEVPSGYEFVGWIDDSGVNYLPDDVKVLKNDVNMYAVWELIVSDETVGDSSSDGEGDEADKITYGDVNLNGEIDSDDYLLVLDYVNDVSSLDGDALVNADVNIDGKVDLVDVDIIKNAFLGTKNYVGYLPNNPILIYDIYEGNIDISDGDVGGSDEGSEDVDNDISSGGGNVGGGGTGGGGASSNSGGNGGVSDGSQQSSGGSGQTGDGTSDDLEKDEVEEEDVELGPIYFEFIYMNGKKKYADTKCDVVNGTCEIVLPNGNPVRSGYTFKGWSENKDCSGDSIINAPVVVDAGNTYYACYLKNIDSEKSGNKYYVWIIVFAISAFSLRLIWHLIYKFRHDESNDNEDNG